MSDANNLFYGQHMYTASFFSTLQFAEAVATEDNNCPLGSLLA